MLRAIPKGVLGQHFTLFQDGTEAARLNASLWKEKAELLIDGKQLNLYREKAFSGRFLMELDGQVLADAVKPSAFKDRFELHLGGVPFEIRGKGFRKVFTVSSGDTPLGRIAKESWFCKRAEIDLPEDWPVPIQAFVFWLVLLMWRRMEAAT